MSQSVPPGGAGSSTPTVLRPPAPTTRNIMSLAWPVVLTNLLVSAVGWVDLGMVGRLGKESFAAVGLSGFIMGLFFLVFMAVAIGTAAVVAQAYGAMDQARVDRATQQSMLLGTGFAFVLTAIACWPGSSLLHRLFLFEDAAPEVARLGAQYLRIVLLAGVPTAVVLIAQAALRSTGDTRTPLWLTLVSNTLNIVLNYMLIFGHWGAPELGVAGAAWGTAISRVVECGSYLALMATRYLRVRLPLRHWALDWPMIRSILRIGLPAAGEQLLVTFGFLMYNKLIATYGTNELAAYQLGVVMLQFAFMPGMGFSQAATALVGQWIGAGDRDVADRAGVACTNLACIFMTAMGVVFVVAAEPFARLYLGQPAVTPLATTFIRLLAISQPTMAIHFTMSGALRGAADTRAPLWAAVISMYLVRLPVALCVVYVFDWSVYWVWMGMVFAHLARAEYLYWRWRRGGWRRIEI